MARWDVTLIDPSSTLSPLILGPFQEDGYDRSRIGQSVDRINAAGKPVIVGASYGDRYLWTLKLLLTEPSALLLELFEELQNTTEYLILQDEVDYLKPKAIGFQKPMLTGSERMVGASAVSGFFRGAVWISFPDKGAPKHAGVRGDTLYKTITLQATEIVGVVP